MKTSDELIRTLGLELLKTIAPYWNGKDVRPLNKAIATVLLAVLKSHNKDAGPVSAAQFVAPLGTSIREVQRQYVLQVLIELNGNKSQASKMLGIDRKSLDRKLKAFRGIKRTA